MLRRLVAVSRAIESYPARDRTNLVHNDVMRTRNDTVRQSVTLPSHVASQNGIEAGKHKQQEFFDLAERYRAATDPEEVRRLGDQVGCMVFGG